MNLLKTDPEKKRLIEASARHKKELESEINSITKRTERILTNTLFIGGAMALTYFAVSQLWGSKSKKKKKKLRKEESEDEHNEVDETSSPTLISQIGDIVITQATMVLLEFAKEKLAEYLHSRKTTDEDS